MRNYAYYEGAGVKNLRELVAFAEKKWGTGDLFRSPNAVGGGYTAVSFKGFAADIEAAGTALRAEGLLDKPLAVMGNNCYGWALTYFATVNSGGRIVPIDPELAPEDICKIINQTGAEVLFHADCCSETTDAVADRCGGLKNVFSIETAPESGCKTIFDLAAQGRALLAGGDDSFAKVVLDNDAPCAIIYTSGTTGAQKGVMLSHANLAVNAVGGTQMMHFAPGDVFLSVLPYHHTYECTCGLMIVMLWGACICFNDSVKNVSKNLARFSPTAILLVPLYIETFYKKIMDGVKRGIGERKLKSALRLSSFLRAFGIDIRTKLFSKILATFGGRLKTIVCGGAYLRPDYVKRFHQFGIQILQGYGITECSPLVAVNRNKCWKYDSAGLPLPCCQVKIADGKKSGEILIKGTNIMQGYFGDPERTAAALADGWYKSGDIGYIGRKNFIYITGRNANLVVFKNGKNASLEEFEAGLTKNDVIKEVVVEARKDEDGVRDLYAYIKVYDELSQKHDELAIRDMVKTVIKEFNSAQPMYKHIKDFALVKTDFPKTTSKKIIRYKVGNRNDV